MQPAHEDHTLLQESLLAVSLELATKSWKIGLSDGKREQPTVHAVCSESAEGRLSEVVEVIRRVQCNWGVSAGARVVVMYEAGQDGFWLQRALAERGYEAVVVDPASIPVERRARRAKTDRLDAIRLVQCLLGWMRGELDRMHVVRVPTEDAEDLRHMVRERGQLQKEVQQHRDRMRKLLRTVGCWEQVKEGFCERLAQGKVCDYAGRALPAHLREQLDRECERLVQVQAQLKRLEESLAHALPEGSRQRVAQLSRLKAIGEVGATRLVLELFWRRFTNRRQVGASVGLTSQPFDSGESRVDQGISKQGNRRVRALLIEMAWMWLRYQPDSALSRGFNAQAQGRAKRIRRIAIVAMARKLAIALWRYLENGVVPEGAVMKR